MKKTFTLAQILSITTGRFVCGDFNLVFEILGFMTGEDDLYLHQLPRVSVEVTPYILEQLPFLNGAGHDINESNWQDRLRELELAHGDKHGLYPMHSEDHVVKDPYAELQELRPDLEIIKVEIDAEPPIDPIGTIGWKE
jgi:hypothetical protein